MPTPVDLRHCALDAAMAEVFRSIRDLVLLASRRLAVSGALSEVIALVDGLERERLDGPAPTTLDQVEQAEVELTRQVGIAILSVFDVTLSKRLETLWPTWPNHLTTWIFAALSHCDQSRELSDLEALLDASVQRELAGSVATLHEARQREAECLDALHGAINLRPSAPRAVSEADASFGAARDMRFRREADLLAAIQARVHEATAARTTDGGAPNGR